MKFKKSLSPIALTLALSGGLLLVGCGEKNAQTQNSVPAGVSVKVFDTAPLDYTITMTLPGRVSASQVAEIRPQVSGIILKREFAESSDVIEGQSLYQIDAAIYQATYESALASLDSAQAKANIAELTVKRYDGLLKTKSISQQEYDQAVADAKQAFAQVKVAQATVNSAKVNLDYTKVYAPINGYIGKSNVTEGALVSAGQATPLAVVQTLNPIYIDMTEAATRFEKNIRNENVIYEPDNRVVVYFPDGTKFNQDGVIKFIDKSVSESTGTVIIRSEFLNPDSKILPGMFVKPKVTLGHIRNAILVPQAGVTSNQLGQYTAIVAVPDDNGSYYVQQRQNIQVYDGIPGYWVITDGINAGEKVVVTGLLNFTGKNLNDPNPEKRIKVNIVGTSSLNQEQLDTIITNNLK